MMNFLASARVMEELMLELTEKGTVIPDHVISSLSSGRSLANISLRLPEEDSEAEMKTLSIFQDAEMNLLSLAEADFGTEYAENWQRKILAAGMEEVVRTAPESASKYIAGVPKTADWVRIQLPELDAVENLQALLEEYSLQTQPQEDGYLLIHGEKANISGFLKAVREIIKKEG